MRLITLIAVGTLAASGVARAQTADGHARATQLQMLEHQRATLLAMADSMPERLYRDKATPAQRDFAQQVHHAAGTVADVASSVLKGPSMTLPDTGSTFNSKAGLKKFINAAFDYSVGVFNAQTPASRTATANLFGKSMPGWQVWDEIYTHTIWTAGQIVANFRKNGMAPPAFTFF